MRTILRSTAILALPALIDAVALSNMTPRATGLTDACQSIYTAQIPGCGPSDFTTLQCTPSCISALEALVAPIQKACGGQGVQGQNLIVAFLAGVGPQQVCHNADTATTTPTRSPTTSTPKITKTKTPTTSATPKIIHSTSTASTAADASSLLVDASSSSSAADTTTRKHTKVEHTATPSSSAKTTSESSVVADRSTTRAKDKASKTTSAPGNYQTSFEDGSGGGSPFDTAGNLMNAAAGFSIPGLSVVLPALAAAAAYIR